MLVLISYYSYCCELWSFSTNFTGNDNNNSTSNNIIIIIVFVVVVIVKLTRWSGAAELPCKFCVAFQRLLFSSWSLTEFYTIFFLHCIFFKIFTGIGQTLCGSPREVS